MISDDPIMRAVIDAKAARRRHGWKTSAEPKTTDTRQKPLSATEMAKLQAHLDSKEG